MLYTLKHVANNLYYARAHLWRNKARIWRDAAAMKGVINMLGRELMYHTVEYRSATTMADRVKLYYTALSNSYLIEDQDGIVYDVKAWYESH